MTESSSEINVKYNDNKDLKKITTDTDYYFDMVANKEKVINIESVTSETSEIKSIVSKKSSSSSKKSSIPRVVELQDSPDYKFSEVKENKPKYSFENKSTSNQNNNNISGQNNNISSQNNNIPNLYNNGEKEMNSQEIKMKKIELLRKLSEIKAKGYQLTKEYDFNSSIPEMEYEYELLKSFADKRNGIKLYKNMLLNGISLMEFVNDKYDPFDFKLSGWSEHMSVEVDSYDDIMEELYEKYKSSGKSMPVEVKLLFLIIASGAAFHFTKAQLGNIPGMASMTGNVIGKMVSKPKENSKFMTPQEINIEKQKELLREKERQLKEKQKNTVPPNPSVFHKSMSRDIPEIRKPDNVQEILNRIKKIQTQNSVNSSETQEENTSNNDRIVSEATITASDKRKKIVKKPVITINT
jgi:hypothetical protein